MLLRTRMHGRIAAWTYKLALVASVIAKFVVTAEIWPSMLLSYSSKLSIVLGPLAAQAAVDLGWHAPAETDINNITTVFNAQSVYGFIFNSSDTVDKRYGTYNWCNMPHARRTEYPKPSSDFSLKYVEVVGQLKHTSTSKRILNCF